MEPTMIQPVPNREQISAVVNLCVEGALNFLMGESTEDRRREMHEEHDALLKIIDQHPVPVIRPVLTPREQIIQDTEESNEHVLAAMTELEKAHHLTKCKHCRETLRETANIVHSKTQEILDMNQKVLMIQQMKEIGDLPQESTWEDLNKVQKKQVEVMVEKFHPLRSSDEYPLGGDKIETKRKNPQPRKVQKPKQKPKRK